MHTVEIPHPAPFLRGGEVILTTGAWRQAGTTADEWAAELSSAGAIAVGFGKVTENDEPPEGLARSAAKHGLGYFVVPVATPFVLIVESFVQAKRSEWEASLREQLGIHDALIGALHAEPGVDSVLRVLRTRHGLEVAVKSDLGTYGVIPAEGHPTPIFGASEIGAHLMTSRALDELEAGSRAAVTSAMPFLALELERERALRAREQRYAAEVVDWIESGNASPNAIADRLDRLGVGVDEPLRAVVAVGRTEDELDRLHPAILVSRDGATIAIVAGGVDRIDGPGYVGVGQAGTVADLRTSLVQARHAIDILRARGAPGWLTYDELGSPTQLLRMQNPTLLRSMAAALLQPIIDHDATRGSQLLETLRVFLDHGNRWQETADVLKIHINTLRYRLRRVEDLTGRVLASTPDRVDLFLALSALEG